MFHKSLTIVLPVYNGESQLRHHVRDMLELASELTSDFRILIVDDGSTDSTYEVADELAAHYPQVAVRRHRHRSGIGPALDYAQRYVRSDAVMFHDGVTPIDINQMRDVWRRWMAQSTSGDASAMRAFAPEDICDFANLPAIHASMERAHSRVLGFQLVVPSLGAAEACHNDDTPTSGAPRTDPAHVARQAGVGRIPRMPRPKFLSALAEFALGE